MKAKSKAEVSEWPSRVPFTAGEVTEVRQVCGASDFPAEILPPEDAAREPASRVEPQRRTAKP